MDTKNDFNNDSNFGVGNYSGGVYQTSQSVPTGGTPINKVKKEGGGAGKYFRKLLASISFGLCFGLFAGLGLYAVEHSTGLLSNMLESKVNVDSIKNMVQDVLSSDSYIESLGLGDKFVSGTSVVQTTSPVTGGVSDVVQEVMPSMVSIINNYVGQMDYFGRPIQEKGSASGSGIIVGENETELLIATNYHVIEDAVSLTVNFIDGTDATATVKGTDPDMDLAVLALSLESLSAETKEAISIARLGNSDDLKIGDEVIAIGNALGYGQSMSGGYISALNREIDMEDGSKGVFIQTDAAINPGNSGGALLNIKGEVIGINSSKIGGDAVEGMGFAIPISAAQPILENLMLRETRNQVADEDAGYIGIRLQTVTKEDSVRYGMPTGVYVYTVMEDSPALTAGLLRGDIITKFDGLRVSTHEDLLDLVKYYSAGETVEVTIMRSENGEYREFILSLTLGTKPQTE